MAVNRFEGITVFEDGPDIFAKNKDERVLFRFNKIDASFAVFRSPRMTDGEKDFCLLMFERFGSKRSLTTKEKLRKALDYEIEEDLFCT